MNFGLLLMFKIVKVWQYILEKVAELHLLESPKKYLKTRHHL